MRSLLDEDSQKRLVVQLLREAAHNVQTVSEAGLLAQSDAQVLAHAHLNGCVVLPRNAKDFILLHESGATHSGILIEHQDNVSGNNMSAADIVRALNNIEASDWPIAGEFAVLNIWH